MCIIPIGWENPLESWCHKLWTHNDFIRGSMNRYHEHCHSMVNIVTSTFFCATWVFFFVVVVLFVCSLLILNIVVLFPLFKSCFYVDPHCPLTVTNRNRYTHSLSLVALFAVEGLRTQIMIEFIASKYLDATKMNEIQILLITKVSVGFILVAAGKCID